MLSASCLGERTVGVDAAPPHILLSTPSGCGRDEFGPGLHFTVLRYQYQDPEGISLGHRAGWSIIVRGSFKKERRRGRRRRTYSIAQNSLIRFLFPGKQPRRRKLPRLQVAGSSESSRAVSVGVQKKVDALPEYLNILGQSC